MSSLFRQTVRGMRDLLPDEAEKLRLIEHEARKLARLYGYGEVITPIMEYYGLLAAKIGEENRKRMYTFEDLGGRKVALRPEFTASISRLIVTKMANAPKPIRFFSTGSLYRYDEPQFGRYREFWQVNYELIGSCKPEADAEIISLSNDLAKSVGLRDFSFKISHVGILRSLLKQEGMTEEQQNSTMQLLDKKQYDEALEFVKSNGGSEGCLDILGNLFKISGEKTDELISAIKENIKDCPEALIATENLGVILEVLKVGCSEAKVVLEAGFARGLEYYTGMIFEVYAPEMNMALGGGGRYDKLTELFGVGAIPAVGVALGIERLSLAADRRGKILKTSQEARILVVPVDGSMLGESFKVASLLRKEGFCTEVETMGRSVSRALSDAGRRGNTHAIIVGPKESKERKVVLRDMRKKSQEVVSLEEIGRKIEC